MKDLKTLMLLFFAASLFTFTACDDDDPEIINEEELITTLNFILTPTGGGSTVTLSFVDLDGDGGNAPVITGGTLQANSTYEGQIEVLNESETPAENITEEVEEEDDEHQFFFSSTVSGLTVEYNDADGDGNPLGLRTNVNTGDAGDGTVTVILRHEPDKNAAGVADGDISNAGGETDIEVTFEVSVQ